VWTALRAHLRKPDAWKLTAGRTRALRRLIDSEGADVLVELGAWLATSGHERAAFLRQRGDLDTVLRPENASKYVAMMHTERASPQPSATGPPPTQKPIGWAERERADIATRNEQMTAYNEQLDREEFDRVQRKSRAKATDAAGDLDGPDLDRRLLRQADELGGPRPGDVGSVALAARSG
jgi:hypothetical protein